jgi:hypothetical protein
MIPLQDLCNRALLMPPRQGLLPAFEAFIDCMKRQLAPVFAGKETNYR